MKTIKLIVIGICVLSFMNVNSQNLTPQQIERENNRIDLFNTQEFANLHIWYNNKVLELRLSEEQEVQYSFVITKYTYRMSRLDDKDSDYSYEEMVEEVHSLVAKIDKDTKPVLTDTQYEDHLKITKEFKQTVLNKLELNHSKIKKG
ncbi:hypothetical protein [Psychroserpens jangbogonensis]|uniref:hypothetical protein n=1 Tax=Psychroserpens jangbogonensis TaxID=1484460 RepID=UPI00053D5AF9|nr:hypothetical protein [Psychroserpens jangbogonensis]